MALHPDFDPNKSSDEQYHLLKRFHFERVVYDELELDEFLIFMPEVDYTFFEAAQRDAVNWRKLPYNTKLAFYSSRNTDSKRSFEEFESFMRVHLLQLDKVQVDCDFIGFGYGNTPSDIYRAKHG